MDVRELRPSAILFSVAVVDNRFHKCSKHGYCLIGEALDWLCEDIIKISDIPKIFVVKRGKEWITVNNRRLWIFRQMERLGKCTTIQVLATIEIKLPSDCAAFKNADVREDPGGLCYLLASILSDCQKIDPDSNMIWGTLQNIKENMFPPPNRRMIITIFQNLLTENQRDDGSSSKGLTLTTGYLHVRCGEFNATQIDYVQKILRTKKWIMDHSVPRNIMKYGRSIRALTIELLPRSINFPPYYRSVPGGSLHFNANTEIDILSDISTISQQGSLPGDTFKQVEMLSAASCQTSGYLFVTGAEYSERSCFTGEVESEGSDDKSVDKLDENEELRLKRRNESDCIDGRNPTSNEITREMIQGIKNILSQEPKRKGKFSKHIPEIQLFMETCIQQKLDINNQSYESKIEALKSDIDNLVSTKDQIIQNLRQELIATKREMQVLQMNQTHVYAPDQAMGIEINTHTSEVLDEREVRGATCVFDTSLSDSQCPAEYSNRTRTDSERTLTEETVGVSDKTVPVQSVYGQGNIDLDFDMAFEYDDNFSSDDNRSENILFQSFWGCCD